MKKYTNAFDLIEDKHQAALLTSKSNYMNQILDAINALKITQKEAAKIMGVTQPRVSDLQQGKISKFSLDLLFVMHSKININQSTTK